MLGGPLVNAAPQSIRHHWCGHVTPTEFIPFSHSDILCMHTFTVASKLHVHAGKNLQAQYERWQPRAKYKMHLDPTMEDVKKLAVSSRRAAKVDTLSLCHCRTQALHVANMHLHFVQPGHAAGVAHCTSSLQPVCRTHAVACLLGLCTNYPSMHLNCCHSLVVLHGTCFHTSCIEHRPPASYDDDSVYSPYSTCICSMYDSVCDACSMQPHVAACKRSHSGFPLWLTCAAE